MSELAEVLIRDATAADLPAIARLHVKVWRETYRDQAPELAWATLDEDLRLARLRALFATPVADRHILLAEAEGVAAGFAVAAPPTEAVFGACVQVRFLYIDGARHGQGIGRRLLAECANRLRRSGAPGLGLGVLATNAPAIAFYEHLGGRQIGTYTDPGPIWRSEYLVYAWDGEAMEALGG